jgi:hypothetical protein
MEANTELRRLQLRQAQPRKRERQRRGIRAQLEKSVARYLAQLDTADLQEPSEELAAETAHLKEKLVKLESESNGWRRWRSGEADVGVA